MSETFLGERLPRSPIRRRLFMAGLMVAMLGLAGALIGMPLYVSRGLDNGPRWIAANSLVLEIAIFIFAAGGTLMAGAQPRPGYLLMGLISAPLAVAIILGLPASARDAFGPFERRSLDIVDWTTTRNGTAVVRTSMGETFGWSPAFGVLTYAPMPPGRYDVLLTSERRRIVGATRAD
jgi:hypothetical protein